MTFTSRFARLIIKIVMIGSSKFQKRFPTGFYTTTVYWGNEYGKTGHTKIFTVLRHFMIILKRNFFRTSILYHISDADNTQGYASQISHR